jgi:CRISPR type IV-associated protein Csf1
MLKTQLVCVTATAMIPAARPTHKKWLLLNPPEPPFVFLQTDSKLSHMIWRTPVTLSKELWYVRLGARLIVVRLPVVHEALKRFNQIAQRFDHSKHKWVPNHPFTSLDFELRNPNCWRIRNDLGPYLERGDLDFITTLQPGEYWALAILTIKKEPENPRTYAAI